ncbi:nitrate reductase cytochrome c-type subunit [Kiloniella antarctica]|uniref:Periplasmic nitrate reductase, electron transfer subunit n=1 Tax=Kiloniella antarctica TaxID=1550907 RepID=A0ABW5BQG6_9PROT
MKKFLISVAAVAGFLAFGVSAHSDGAATLRQGTPITSEAEAPKMNKVENKDVKRIRNYPEQPPTIPHKIRSYEISTNANKCLSCHARTRTGESQAPMVSVTHYMDRDNQVLATVSPRRYFCTQCHVTQVDAPPLVENEFIDVEHIIKAE